MGHVVDARRVAMDEPIKALGVYQVPIKLTAGVVAEVKVWVVADRSEPEPVVEPVAEEAVEAAPVDADDVADEEPAAGAEVLAGEAQNDEPVEV
jgi:large subunit ribosomal protein L9